MNKAITGLPRKVMISPTRVALKAVWLTRVFTKDQEDGEQQDGEGQAGAGQLFGAEQLGEVFVFQLFAGLDIGVDLIQNLQLSFGCLLLRWIP